MELGVIIKAALLGLIHWSLVPIALGGLIRRQRVLGGRKAPWVLAIVFLTCFGPLFYLLLHPQLQTQSQRDWE